MLIYQLLLRLVSLSVILQITFYAAYTCTPCQHYGEKERGHTLFYNGYLHNVNESSPTLFLVPCWKLE